MDTPANVAAPKKRILYVITKSSWGGATRYVFDMAVASKKAGYEVTVAAGGDGPLKDYLEKEDIPFVPIGGLKRDVNAQGEVRAFLEVRRLCRTFKPDVVHVNSSKGGVAALAARTAFVRRVVFTVHGWAWNEERPFYQKVLIWFAYYLTILLCHRVIVVSHAAKRQAHFPLLNRKMEVIHNGISPFPLLTREEARERLLPNSARGFWVGAIAELHPIKNLPVLIEAYEHFVPDEPKSELVIIGDGELRSALERQIEIEGVSATTHLVGHVAHARQYLPAFDILVLPSRSENLPYALLEAGMAGCAVIASDVGGIPEIIEDDKTGMLVPQGDRGALTSALEYLAAETGLRKTLGENLHKKIESDFSMEQMVEKTLKVYQ